MDVVALLAAVVGFVSLVITVKLGNKLENRILRYLSALGGVVVALIAMTILFMALNVKDREVSVKAGEYLAAFIIIYTVIRFLFSKKIRGILGPVFVTAVIIFAFFRVFINPSFLNFGSYPEFSEEVLTEKWRSFEVPGGYVRVDIPNLGSGMKQVHEKIPDSVKANFTQIKLYQMDRSRDGLFFQVAFLELAEGAQYDLEGGLEGSLQGMLKGQDKSSFSVEKSDIFIDNAYAKYATGSLKEKELEVQVQFHNTVTILDNRVYMFMVVYKVGAPGGEELWKKFIDSVEFDKVMEEEEEVAEPSDEKIELSGEYVQKCENGDAKMCYRLYQINEGGVIAGLTKEKAKSYLYRACNLELAKACLDIAVMFDDGKKEKMDKEKAKLYYEKACNGKNSDACNNLGMLYYTGEGIDEDRGKAKKYLKKACDLGLKQACTPLP